MFIETETTPNPSSLKFLPGQQVMGQGTREFATPEAAEASPLAQAIFDTGEVVNVFFGGDFVTVTAAPGVNWTDLKPQVLAILLDHFVAQAPLFTPGSAGGISVPPEDQGMLVDERDEAARRVALATATHPPPNRGPKPQTLRGPPPSGARDIIVRRAGARRGRPRRGRGTPPPSGARDIIVRRAGVH